MRRRRERQTRFALDRYAGVKARDIKARLGDTALPSILQAKHKIASGMIPAMDRMQTELNTKAQAAKAEQERQRQALVAHQRDLRAKQAQMLEQRQWQEARHRQARFRPGLGGLWDKLRGEHARIRRENEQDALKAMQRDRAKRDELILRQIDERRRLTVERVQAQSRLAEQQKQIVEERKRFEAMRTPEPKPAFRQASQERGPPKRPPGQHPGPEPTKFETVANDDRAERLKAFREKRRAAAERRQTRDQSGPDHSR